LAWWLRGLSRETGQVVLAWVQSTARNGQIFSLTLTAPVQWVLPLSFPMDASTATEKPGRYGRTQDLRNHGNYQ